MNKKEKMPVKKKKEKNPIDYAETDDDKKMLENVQKFIEVDTGFSQHMKINNDGTITIFPERNISAANKAKLHRKMREIVIRAVSAGMSFAMAAHLIGITPASLNNWLTEHPEFKRRIEQAKASKLVKYQAMLDQHIEEGSLQALLFVLKTQYGYNEHMVIEAAGGIRAIGTYDVAEMKDVNTQMSVILAKNKSMEVPEALQKVSLKNKKNKKKNTSRKDKKQ